MFRLIRGLFRLARSIAVLCILVFILMAPEIYNQTWIYDILGFFFLGVFLLGVAWEYGK